MPRVARNIVTGIPYHVIHRGNNRQKIFFSDTDYSYFLSLMNEAKKKYECKLYSYVLMPNHIHFLLESPLYSETIAKFIKFVVQKYAQYINKLNNRTGTLWEGRYKSSPVSKDNYLLACTRYIELNPVRAKIVNEPEDYRWSSYRFKVGDIDIHHIIDENPLYFELGKELAERQVNYKKWIKESINPEERDYIRKAVNKGGVFGNNQFKEKLEKLLKRSFEMKDKGRPQKT